ncbi:heme-binding protein 2-like [Xenopus laevis]|uniref:Heme-binding protein 2 n=2 Tax=Xenopus laevis TaxID=8355 RepID=A0A974HH38_XENLA|nr:heme-binding protein 2-like [Xenopus laevis]OCT77764.1 hypothetical protein XELAEV_18028859mg [Xenopus laevis]
MNVRFLGMMLIGFFLFENVVEAKQTACDCDEDKLPAFCRGITCPKYTLVEKNKNFELRTYQPTSWVTTSLDKTHEGFLNSIFHLTMYMNGNNSDGILMEMAVPILVIIPVGKSPVNRTMMFLLPTEIENPPAPADADISFQNFKATSVYLRTFTDFSDGSAHAKKLAEVLNSQHKGFDRSFFILAIYHDPILLIGRHFEVWFLAN